MKFGYIYKITNIVNNKVYIGQVSGKTIYERFKRHVKDSKKLNTYIGRAIQKYGYKNFTIDEIDFANNQKELNEKEIYWIKYFHSTNQCKGYNLTDGGDGGNTYKYKTQEELNLIKEKISIANFGNKNGMAKAIKGYNYKTNEIVHFNTVAEAQSFFNIKGKGPFSCKQKYLWRNQWEFVKENYNFSYILKSADPSTRTGHKVIIINKQTQEEKQFISIAKTYEYLTGKTGKKLSVLKNIYSDKYDIFEL